MLPAEAQTVGGNVAVNDFFEARFIDRNFAGLQRLNFFRIVIDADDVVTDIGKTGASNKADITGTND